MHARMRRPDKSERSMRSLTFVPRDFQLLIGSRHHEPPKRHESAPAKIVTKRSRFSAILRRAGIATKINRHRMYHVGSGCRGTCHRAGLRADPFAYPDYDVSVPDQIPATDDHSSDSLRFNEAIRVNGCGSSSSGRRSPTTLTLPPEMLRATRSIVSSASVAPSFGA